MKKDGTKDRTKNFIGLFKENPVLTYGLFILLVLILFLLLFFLLPKLKGELEEKKAEELFEKSIENLSIEEQEYYRRERQLQIEEYYRLQEHLADPPVYERPSNTYAENMQQYNLVLRRGWFSSCELVDDELIRSECDNFVSAYNNQDVDARLLFSLASTKNITSCNEIINKDFNRQCTRLTKYNILNEKINILKEDYDPALENTELNEMLLFEKALKYDDDRLCNELIFNDYKSECISILS